MTHFLLAAAAQPSAGSAFFMNIMPLLLIFVIFWFLLIRPQQKRMREHQAELSAIKKGDKVVTGGGLIGKVTRVADDELEVELAQGVRVTAVRGMISTVIKPNTKPAND